MLCLRAPTEAGWPSECEASFLDKRALDSDAGLSFLPRTILNASYCFILYSMYIRTSVIYKRRASLDKPMFVFGDVGLAELSDRICARSCVLAHVLTFAIKLNEKNFRFKVTSTHSPDSR